MTTLELLQLQNEHKDNFFGKGEDNMTGYEILSQEIRKYQREHYEKTNNWEEEFIVLFDYKHDWEKRYSKMSEYFFIYDDKEGIECAHGWYEGQKDIVVKKIFALSELYDVLLTKQNKHAILNM